MSPEHIAQESKEFLSQKRQYKNFGRAPIGHLILYMSQNVKLCKTCNKILPEELCVPKVKNWLLDMVASVVLVRGDIEARESLELKS